MKIEFNQVKVYKQKYSDLFREFTALSEDKNHIQKHLERAIQNK